MPYKTINQLPDAVKNHLPKHAQEIYKEAFNNALEQYQEHANPEETAHKVAWNAVKTKYKKNQDGNWHPK